MAAERARNGLWAVGVRGAELNPLEALSAKNVETLQHPGAFVVAVVLLVADGAFHIHGFPWTGATAGHGSSSGIPLLRHWGNMP